jgi:hypothetical protein
MELWKKPHDPLSIFNENPLNSYLISGLFSMWEEAKEEEGCELI